MTMAWNRSSPQSTIFLLGIVASANIFAAVPTNAESINKGRALYMSNCTACHGNDGKSQVDVVSNATDLTEPLLYHNGATDADISRSIRDGIGGVMPAWGAVFNNEESIEHLKNFIKSLWPAKK
jgi:cbb3-type cytochrome c oxidase subunit III